MDFIINTLHFLLIHRFGFLVAGILAITLRILFRNKIQGMGKGKKTTISVFITLFTWPSILFFFFGVNFTNKLIYNYGEMGVAKVIDIYETGDMYNKEPVLRYEMVLKTKEGKTVETTFESIDPIMYPPDNDPSFPDKGVEVSVQYISNNPNAFVIVTNDDSAFALGLDCTQLEQALNKAKNKFEFDIGNKEYREEYRKIIDKYLDSNCIETKAIIEFYKQERQKTL